MDAEIDTFNKHMVGVQGGNIVVLMPPHGPMTKQEAMVFAAWLVTLADHDEQFPKVLAAVQS
jgi:hypothetical protein